MAILLSGDFHADADNELQRITKKNLVQRYTAELFDGIQYHIILGDGGFLWPGNENGDMRNYRELSRRPFPVLCVFGNHEPALGRRDLPEADIGIGEKVIVVHDKNPFVAYLKRGKEYLIEEHKFLVMGGALSIDREYRRPNQSWWENEYWSRQETAELFEYLEKKNVFDFVLSHTGPGRINEVLFDYLRMSQESKFYDEVAVLNDAVDKKIICRQWFCGHWHKDEFYQDKKLERSYQYLYKKTALIRGNEVIVL